MSGVRKQNPQPVPSADDQPDKAIDINLLIIRGKCKVKKVILNYLFVRICLGEILFFFWSSKMQKERPFQNEKYF